MSTFTRRSLIGTATAAAFTGVADLNEASAAVHEPHSPAAALVRFEQTLEILRTCVVFQGFKLDEDLAAPALASLRRQARVGEWDDEGDLDDPVHKFMHVHGLSFDWIFRGDVGSMIGAFAADAHQFGDEKLSALIDQIEALHEKAEQVHSEGMDPHDDGRRAIFAKYSDLPRGHREQKRFREELDAYLKRAGWSRAWREWSDLKGQIEPLIDELWQTPALTSNGRRAKVKAFLLHVGGEEWLGPKIDLERARCRELLAELAGISAGAIESIGGFSAAADEAEEEDHHA